MVYDLSDEEYLRKPYHEDGMLATIYAQIPRIPEIMPEESKKYLSEADLKDMVGKIQQIMNVIFDDENTSASIVTGVMASTCHLVAISARSAALAQLMSVVFQGSLQLAAETSAKRLIEGKIL